MQATEITRFENGAVKFEFEGEQYLMNHTGAISWATPGGWARVATDDKVFPVMGPEFNSGTVYADTAQTFAGTVEASRLLDLVYVDNGDDGEAYLPVCVLESCLWALADAHKGATTVGGVTRPVTGPANCKACGASL